MAERFELAHESAGAVFGVVAGRDPVGAEVVVVDVVVDDVPVGDDQIVTDSAGGLGAATTSTQLHVARGEVGVLAAGGGLGGLGQRVTQPLVTGPGVGLALLAARGVVARATPRPTRQGRRQSGTGPCPRHTRR